VYNNTNCISKAAVLEREIPVDELLQQKTSLENLRQHLNKICFCARQTKRAAWQIFAKFESIVSLPWRTYKSANSCSEISAFTVGKKTASEPRIADQFSL
jgi:hypothetical protein